MPAVPSLGRARDARGDIFLGRNVAQQRPRVRRERETVTLAREQGQLEESHVKLNFLAFLRRADTVLT